MSELVVSLRQAPPTSANLLCAGFVGFDEFHLLRSAALLVIHTFGAMVLVALALPITLCVLQQTAEAAREPCNGRQHAPELPPVGPGWERALLAFLLVRSSTTFAAMLSAAVQRRHLYAWALFAPKFAFEAVFLLGTDALLALLCLLL